ncbi:MAG: GNAT family N-acetyltransferase [Prolixibacteraceae bacterium]|jgi:GNAT superfamily N-acetyltransferase|nr:GNAT family N-acetyltransferase [Prolixibacteraceae bacterium]
MNRNQYKKIKVRTWYLSFSKTKIELAGHHELELWNKPTTRAYLKLYKAVGEKWGWTGRLLIDELQLSLIIHSNLNEIWLYKIDNELKGYFEIDYSSEGKAEIVYLGLLPEEIGKGFGKDFLNAAISTAARRGDKVWLHTCEFDHPKALELYQNAGFQIDNESVEEEYYSYAFLKKKNNNI